MRVEKAALGVGELGVWVAGDEEVDAVTQVVDEADLVDEARGGGDEGEGGDVGRDEQGEFLGDHSAHTHANDVEVSSLCRRVVVRGGRGGPGEVVEELEDVFGHLRGRITGRGFRRGAHTAVIEDEGGVGGGVGVAEVAGLAPPVRLEGAEAHDPLE